MTTIGCCKENQSVLAEICKKIITEKGLPLKVIIHKDAGVGILTVVKGRDRCARKARLRAWEAFHEGYFAIKDKDGLLGNQT